jgi:hypothetical protein
MHSRLEMALGYSRVPRVPTDYRTALSASSFGPGVTVITKILALLYLAILIPDTRYQRPNN